MIEKVEEEFEEYINNYDKGVKEIRYKYLHSYKVEKLMEELSKRINLNSIELELAKIIGLLHDIGRFEQIKRFGICSDSITGVDHADESCKYLFDDNHIRDFISENKYDLIIKNAIINHNKYEIDKSVNGKSLLFSKMIRDMDKVDIYRVLSEEYKGTFSRCEINEKVLESFKKHKTVDSHLKKSESDAFIAHLAFIYDFNYKESLSILNNTSNLKEYLKTIEIDNKNKKEYIENNKLFNELINEVDSFIKEKKEG